MAADLPNDTQFAESVADVEDLLMTVMQTLESPKVESLPYMSTGSIRRILSLHEGTFPETVALDSTLYNETEHFSNKSESMFHAYNDGWNKQGNASTLDDELPNAGGRDGAQNDVRFLSAQSKCAANSVYLSFSLFSVVNDLFGPYLSFLGFFFFFLVGGGGGVHYYFGFRVN